MESQIGKRMKKVGKWYNLLFLQVYETTKRRFSMPDFDIFLRSNQKVLSKYNNGNQIRMRWRIHRRGGWMQDYRRWTDFYLFNVKV